MSNVEATKPAHPMIAFRDQFVRREPELKAALPSQISPQRFTRVALTAIQLNQELLTADRQSLWNALMRCAADGLVPDGRQAAIVLFNDNKNKRVVAQYMPMIAGLLQRFRNSGQFKSVGSGVVHEGDEFNYWIDENGEHLRHVPGDGTGKPIKAYARASTVDGGTMVKVMSYADVEKRRAVSRAKDGPMWREWWDEAAQKTVLRNLMKRLPSSSDDIDRLLGADDDEPIDNTPIAPPAEQQPEPPQQPASIASAFDQFGGADESPQQQPEPPADPPLVEDIRIATAHERGVQARKDGFARKALPPEYREKGRELEADAWREGFDTDPQLKI